MASSQSTAATNSDSVASACFSAALEAALARYLALDPNSPPLLAPLLGQVIALTLTPFDFTLYLCANEQRVVVLTQAPPLQAPAVTLRGSIAGYARLALAEDAHAELFSGRVQISGDPKTARAFQNLFQRLDIDWEEHAAQFAGDYIAHRSANLIRTGRQWLSDTQQTLRLNLAEYLQEEIRALPNDWQIDEFCRAIDRLREEHDRLEARVQRLERVIAVSA